MDIKDHLVSPALPWAGTPLRLWIRLKALSKQVQSWGVQDNGPQVDNSILKWSQWPRGRLSENRLQLCIAVIGQSSVGASFSRGTRKNTHWTFMGSPGLQVHSKEAPGREHPCPHSADFYCCPEGQLRVCSSVDTVKQVALVNWHSSQVPDFILCVCLQC